MLLINQSPALLSAWMAWCLGHSLTATVPVKKSLSEAFNLSPQHYRLGYVLFSTLTLVPLLLWQHHFIGPPTPATWPWQMVRIILFAYGIVMFSAGGQSYNLREFLGLTAVAGSNTFRRNGVLERVRHPWYSGGIALLIAAGETPGDRLDWRLLLVAYLIFGCLNEERRLVAELHEVYRKYQREVPMLFPRLRKIN